MTGLDYVDRMALIALQGDEMIGGPATTGCACAPRPRVALFVDDANHGRGLATAPRVPRGAGPGGRPHRVPASVLPRTAR